MSRRRSPVPSPTGNAKAREERRREQADDDLRAVLSTREGRAVVWRVVDEVAGTFSGTFTGSSQTFHLEGRRSVGIDVMREAQRVAPQLYLLALSERMDEVTLETSHRAAEDGNQEREHD